MQLGEKNVEVSVVSTQLMTEEQRKSTECDGDLSGRKEVPSSETFVIDNKGPKIKVKLEEGELEIGTGKSLRNDQSKDPTMGDVATNLKTTNLK